MKKALSVIRNIGFVLLVLFICFMILSMSQNRHLSIAGYEVLRVLTSSMEPTIPENTCIITKKVSSPEELKVGDIITFVSEDSRIQGFYNTHRIAEIIEQEGETLYITKGDNNPEADELPVREEQIASIFVRELPGGQLLGKAFVALSDNKIYFVVIILPLTLCLLSYFWQILGMITGRYEDDSEDDEQENEPEGEKESGDIEVLKKKVDRLEQKVADLSDKMDK